MTAEERAKNKKRSVREALVRGQERAGEELYHLWLYEPEVSRIAHAGQFVMLACRDSSRMLPRPFGFSAVRAEEGLFRITYRLAGAGTREFSCLAPGDGIPVNGPLGRGFLEVSGIPGPSEHCLLIGGGTGVAPLLPLAQELDCRVTCVMGYRSGTVLAEEFSAEGSLFVSTEDGSNGTRGTVMDVLAEKDIAPDRIYACGPLPMLRAVKEYSEHRKIPLWVSLEERMACGIGACLGCVVQTPDFDPHSHVHNRRVCRDGPVFAASEVIL